MFLQTNDRLINLKNVSNINILPDRNRIIFNMNYSIEMGNPYTNDTKMISDYVYWDAYNKDDLMHNLLHLNRNTYFKNSYINQLGGVGYININEISSVKFSEKKNRVIFNLSHPVTFTNYEGEDKITSEFVYVNCPSREKYDEYVAYVQDCIGE